MVTAGSGRDKERGGSEGLAPADDTQSESGDGRSPTYALSNADMHVQSSALLFSMYEMSILPTVLISASMEVVRFNEAARKLFELSVDLAHSSGKLRLTNKGIEATLVRAFEMQALKVMTARNGNPAFVSLDGHLRRIEAGKLAIVLRDVAWIDDVPFFVAQFIDSETEQGFRLEVLMRIGMTAAEAQLALALYRGMSVADYGKNAGIAVSTARTHLSRAMSKLGASKQVQLVAKLAALFAQK